MTTEQRFLFNRDFDPDLLVNGGSRSANRAEGDKRAKSPPKAAFTEEDLAHARAEGFAEGCEQASRDAAQSLERRLSEAFETVGKRLGAIIEATDAARDAAARDANAIAIAIARRMVPELYQRNAAAEIERTVTTVLSQVLETDGLTIHTAESLADPLGERIRALADTRGFGGRVRIAADASLREGDCRIEWLGGGAERISAALWTEIDDIVSKNLGRVAAPVDDDTESRSDRGDVNEENTTLMLECGATAPSAEIEVGETHG